MEQKVAQTPTEAPAPLDYARHSLRRRHSFYSCASLVMAS